MGALLLGPTPRGGLALVVAGDAAGLRDAVSAGEPTIPPMARAPFSNTLPDYLVTGPRFGALGYGGVLQHRTPTLTPTLSYPQANPNPNPNHNQVACWPLASLVTGGRSARGGAPRTRPSTASRLRIPEDNYIRVC